MTITTSNEQQAIATALAGWAAARRVRELVRSDIDTGAASWRPLWGELAEFGVFAAGVDEAAGGAGGTFGDTAAILAACGAELVPGPLGASAAAAAALARQGSPL
ncbi:putative acyl-CoA dehydrogenase, partial [Gordonia hirsuta DSM 44140 = NBRC 16056]